jgi:hypothetical protein
MALHIELTCESPRLYKAYIDGVNLSVGSLELSEDNDYVEFINVFSAYARQGIATAMYDFVEADLGYTLKPSKWLTRDGAAFRANRAKKTVEPTVHNDGIPYASAYAHARRLSTSVPGAFSLV